MSEKIYCGNAKEITTQYGKITKISFHKDDVQKMVDWMKSDGGQWVNIAIMEKKDPAQGKPTHYGVIDEWKPNTTSEPAFTANDKPRNEPPSKDETDDLPF